MTHAVVAVSQDTSFKEIVHKLQERHVSALPVLEGDGRVVGVVSEADLLPKEARRSDPPHLYETPERLEEVRKSAGVTAADLMSSPAVSVRADVPLAAAARAMARRRLKRLPVVDGQGCLVGIVSRMDLLKTFLRPDDRIAEEIRGEVFGLVPGAGADLRVEVEDGVATVGGELPDSRDVAVLARLVRSVEGVVDVRFDLA
ncbi:CBS domain-containing protein [Streptomyces ovatisporus]|uniref:CBS domain-containing protein n=1 Tax=Streptomyces ovatisporus TaxID=1128682 RepID=A0ABV9A8A6_9ACTN